MNQPVDKSIYRFLTSNIFEKDKSLENLYIDDPTVMGFNFMVDIYDWYSPLFTETNDGASAIQYLKNVGEPARAVMLKEFKFRLRDLIINFPFYFQLMTGLEEFYKYNPKETWRTRERRITIKTLESLDLRVANMIDKYMKASFDENYMRECIPINLRKFNAYIVLTEIRNFKTFYDQVILNPIDDTKISILNDHLSNFVIKLEGCRFDFSESNPWMEEISNANPEKPIENQFSLVFDKISEIHKMNMIQVYTGTLTAEESRDLDKKAPNYRKIQWGVPDEYVKPKQPFYYMEKEETPNLGTIKSVEKQTSSETGKGILDAAKSFILQQPEIQRVIQNYDPNVLLGRVENLALDQIRKVAGEVILGNVFDFRSSLFNTDLIQAAIDRLAGTNSRPGPQQIMTVDVGGHTVYDNNVNFIEQSGHTEYNDPLGNIGPGFQTVYNNGLNSLGTPGHSVYPISLGGFGTPGHLPNNQNIGNLPIAGHTTYNGLPRLSIYNLNPEIIKSLGYVEREKLSDFFRTYLGNVFGVERKPFSNLLSTLVGGAIPDLIKQK